MKPRTLARAPWTKPHWANKLTYRPRRRPRGVEYTVHLNQSQVAALRTIVATYAPDLHDPAAVEVLLVLLEVSHILDLSAYRQEKIFGRRLLRGLATWGDIVPPKRRPPQLQRAWVWLPNQPNPTLHPITPDGAIHLYPPQPAAPTDAPTDDPAAAEGPAADPAAAPFNSPAPAATTAATTAAATAPSKALAAAAVATPTATTVVATGATAAADSDTSSTTTI